MSETWHVVLFHVHPDGQATEFAWWVDERYATDMLAHMGEPDGQRVYSAADVQESIEGGSKVPMFTREAS